MSSTVFDASALLALLYDEPGADRVAEALRDGAAISAVNLAEVLSRIADDGGDPMDTLERFIESGLLDGALAVETFGSKDAALVGSVRPPTRAQGLSLADRVCLVLAQRLDVPALTADSAWSEVDVGVEVRQIR